MTIIDHTFLCKWPNLQNRQGFKYLFSPLPCDVILGRDVPVWGELLGVAINEGMTCANDDAEVNASCPVVTRSQKVLEPLPKFADDLFQVTAPVKPGKVL